MNLKAVIPLYVALMIAAAPACAQETQPGDACTAGQHHHYRQVGGPESPGAGYMLVCDGATWLPVTTWDTGTGRSLFQVDYDPAPCTGPKDGRIRYNSTGSPETWEYCDGGTSTWRPFESAAAGAACGGPALCPQVGDICDDGDAGTAGDPIFAGFLVDADGVCEYLYVTRTTQSASSSFKTSAGVDDIATDSIDDGRVNDAQIPDSATFPAFKLCKDLNDGGFTDWYLPSRNELALLWKHKALIDANADDPLATTWHVSSSENSTHHTWLVNMWDGWFFEAGFKPNNDPVRCVRRE